MGLRSKVGNKEFQRRALRAVRKAEVPVTIDYVASKLSVSWSTARTILLELALSGKVVAEKTLGGSWIFRAPTQLGGARTKKVPSR